MKTDDNAIGCVFMIQINSTFWTIVTIHYHTIVDSHYIGNGSDLPIKSNRAD